MDPNHVSIENVAAILGVGIAAAWVAARKYLAQLKAPAVPATTDVIVAGAALADMAPIRDIDAKIGRVAVALERIADAIEQSAEEDEIERRAKARAAEIIAANKRRS